VLRDDVIDELLSLLRSSRGVAHLLRRKPPVGLLGLLLHSIENIGVDLRFLEQVPTLWVDLRLRELRRLVLRLVLRLLWGLEQSLACDERVLDRGCYHRSLRQLGHENLGDRSLRLGGHWLR